MAVKFPFSDLTRTKLRPALVLADVDRGDFILCQITSKAYADPLAIKLEKYDFIERSLPLVSYVRPGKLFTAHQSLIEKKLCNVRVDKHAEVLKAVGELLFKHLEQRN